MNHRRSLVSLWMLMLCCILLSLGIVVPVQAQSTNQHESSERPLGDVLTELASLHHVDLIYDPELTEGLTTSVELQNIPFEDMLRRLLADTHLDYRRLPSGTYQVIRRVVQPRVLYGAVEGSIIDRETGEPLPNAHVLLADASAGTATDDRGLFSFNRVEPGQHYVLARFLGYNTVIDTVQVIPDQRTVVEIALEPQALIIAPLVVEGTHDPHETSGLVDGFGNFAFQAMGRPDVVLGLNQLMGVRVGDATADVHVQGGESGEHQFRLDGVPIFEPVHLRGLLGAFSPFAIQRITVHKAGFGAPFGSHLSGVLLAEHSVTGPPNRNLDLQVDPLSFNGRLYGAVGKPGGFTGRFMATLRRSLWDVYQPDAFKNLLKEWNTPDTFLPQYSLYALKVIDESLIDGLPSLDTLRISPLSEPALEFTDLHAVARLQFGPSHRIYTSFYRGLNRLNGNQTLIHLESSGDGLDVEEDPFPKKAAEGEASLSTDEYGWTNSLGLLEYTGAWSPRVAAKLRLHGSRYRLSHTYNTSESGIQGIPMPDGSFLPIRYVSGTRATDDGNGISEAGVEATLDFAPHRRHLFEVGVEAVRTDSRFSIEDVFSRPITHEANDWRVAGFIQERALIGNGVEVTAGLRATSLSQQEPVFLEPRLSLGRKPGRGGRWTWNLSTGIYRQFINQFSMSVLSPSALLSSIRFWLPVDSTVTPPKAYHFAAGAGYSPSSRLSLRLESYYKKQPHLLTIDYPALKPDLELNVVDTTSTGQQSFIRDGNGFAYGGTLSAEYTTTYLRFMVRYNFNVARRTRTLLPDNTTETNTASALTAEESDPAEESSASRYEQVPWNEPHRIDVAVDWSPIKPFSATVRWTGAWGRRWGFRQSYYDYLATYPVPTHQIGDINFLHPDDHRLEPIYQLDVGLAYTLDFDVAALQLRLDVLNVLDRDNTADWTARPVQTEGQTFIEKVPRTLLPRIATLAVRLAW